MIRKATDKDINRISEIYSAIHDTEEKGILTIGWSRDTYPVRETAETALKRDDLFVCEDNGKVVAAAVINQIQVPEYANCHWKYPADDAEVMVLHTLVVAPETQGHGYGAMFAAYYEEYAKECGCHYLRIDTQEKNTRARAFYRKLGYDEIGFVECVFNGISGVRLVCLEKLV